MPVLRMYLILQTHRFAELLTITNFLGHEPQNTAVYPPKHIWQWFAMYLPRIPTFTLLQSATIQLDVMISLNSYRTFYETFQISWFWNYLATLVWKWQFRVSKCCSAAANKRIYRRCQMKKANNTLLQIWHSCFTSESQLVIIPIVDGRMKISSDIFTNFISIISHGQT